MLEVPYLAVHSGEVLGLVGPNGAGKSTLLLVLGLLHRPAAGEVRFRGFKIDGRRNLLSIRRRLAMVFQSPLLLDMNVYDNVAIGLRLRRLPREEVRCRAEEALGLFGIGHLARRHARALSGGEAQRVNLARAFALRPDVLLLDEPFAGLDTPSRLGLLRELKDILGRTGITAVMATHDYTELPVVADRVAIMAGGHLEGVGPVEKMIPGITGQAVAAGVVAPRGGRADGTGAGTRGGAVGTAGDRVLEGQWCSG